MKNTQENLSTLTIWSRNVTTSTREPLTCAWIPADIWCQDGAICSKNRKIVPYHRCARIPRLTVSVPDYGSWFKIVFLWLDRNTELARAVDVMMARAKRIYILIIKVNKLFSFFWSRCFLKEIENMFSVLLSNYRNTRESLGELEKAVETVAYGSCSHSISRSPKLPLVFL